MAVASVQTDVGSVYWLNAYTYSNAGAISVIDGDVSPDNTRYNLLVSVNNAYSQILSLKI